jgi:hypothetical protein
MAGPSSGLLGRFSADSCLIADYCLVFHFTSDPTGYSWHGDFQNGWDTEVLQTAIDTCNNPNDGTGDGVIEACKALVLQDDAVSKTCKAVPELTETIGGQLDKLPG